MAYVAYFYRPFSRSKILLYSRIHVTYYITYTYTVFVTVEQKMLTGLNPPIPVATGNYHTIRTYIHTHTHTITYTHIYVSILTFKNRASYI